MNVIVSYIAGSGGEIFINPLLTTGLWRSPILAHNLDVTGRMVALLDTTFIDRFQPQPDKYFYSRNWQHDYHELHGLQPWLMPIADQTQARFLKDISNDNVFLITINYSESEFEFVLNSFCRKVLDQPHYLTRDGVGQRFLDSASQNEEQRQWLIQCGRDGLLGKWYQEQYQNGSLTFPPKSNNMPGDLEINVADLFDWNKLLLIYKDIANRLSITIDLELAERRHQAWLHLQSRLTNNS